MCERHGALRESSQPQTTHRSPIACARGACGQRALFAEHGSFDVIRVKAALACLATVATCFAYNHYRGQLPDWWRENGGGIPYVVFWITFLFFFLPKRRYVLPISISATLLTCLLEFMQLWKPPWLTQFRSTTFGAALLGSGFVWKDIPPYLIGGLVGYWILIALVRNQRPERPNRAT
jgi:uncharacterized protein DUF2809